MKVVSIIAAALASSSATIAAIVPVQPRDVADGFYQVVTDDAGNTRTEFKAFDFGSAKTSPNEARVLEKRAEACGSPVNAGEVDQANECLINSFFGNNVYLRKNQWTYCVRGKVVSFICPYSDGDKSKNNISGAWGYVRGKCGSNKAGYSQVLYGNGDWTAGYAPNDGISFCTAGFHA
ncbi:hypothetical protein C2857_006220 [Epichloe festucae Fl1]|uniref:Uncharacterized protein n=1 Tax=Epichloe festucae (strain Fl1) TaxID=877507 RepID=A0A7S9PUH0_EPIFF|nr:hypothetical protein C2857_006220 [Epichloe festucae Fl1]